jgi:hypothetical protein
VGVAVGACTKYADAEAIVFVNEVIFYDFFASEARSNFSLSFLF